MNEEGKCITMVLKKPNPLFEKWLTEWRDEAKNRGVKSASTYNYALSNLRKYKIPLNSGQECKIIKGFGNKLCSMLDAKVRAHKEDCTAGVGSLCTNERKRNIKKHPNKINNGSSEANHVLRESGPSDEIMNVDEKLISKFPSTSSVSPAEKVGSDSTCTTMPNHNFVRSKTIGKQASSGSFDSLLKKSSRESVKSKTTRKHTSGALVDPSRGSVQIEHYVMEPGSFDIILYVDTQETAGSNTDIKDDPLLRHLNTLCVSYEIKHLNIGDYVWICRHRTTKQELVLPFITERKRLDDLAKSIKDGRYHEQKFRLKKSGIPNITYLIENYNKQQYAGLPLPTLRQAAANTAIQDGFYVKFTSDIKHTARHLANFTKHLVRNFSSKLLASCAREDLPEFSITGDFASLMAFQEFNKSSTKNKPMKVGDLFVKMLVQIKGMSIDKAMAITAKYPTPFHLRRAYLENDDVSGEKLLGQIQFGKSKRSVGFTLSKVVYDLFTSRSFPR